METVNPYIVINQVLVLNATFEPINICNVRRAIVLISKGIAYSEEITRSLYRSPSVQIPVPAVIRLTRYVRLALDKKTFSKRHIFIRDFYTCQYCNVRIEPSKLTLDHVLPQSRGGKSIWENLVTCCRSCNGKKGDRTPAEAGMPLNHRPKPSRVLYLHMLRVRAKDNVMWQKYLYYH